MRPELALARRVQAFRMRTMPDAPHATPKQWYEFSNQTTDGGSNTDLYIFDEISWWGITAMDLVRELMTIDTDTITVRLNSPGGDVWDGIAIKNALITHRSKVNVIVDGDAASIASVIMLAGETITMMPGSFVMIHQAATFCGGTAGDMRECADLLDLINLNIAEMYAARTGKPVQHFLDAMAVSATNMGTRYTAEDAVAVGLADVLGDGATRTSGKSVVPGQAGGDDGFWDHAGRPCKCGENNTALTVMFQHKPECTATRRVHAEFEKHIRIDDHGTWHVIPRNVEPSTGALSITWEWNTGDTNPCDECQFLADSSPYADGDQPEDPPLHPNCDCTLQSVLEFVDKTTATITAVDPFTAHFTSSVIPVEVDADELVRDHFRKAFA